MRDQQIVKVQGGGQPIHARGKSLGEANLTEKRAEQLGVHT